MSHIFNKLIFLILIFTLHPNLRSMDPSFGGMEQNFGEWELDFDEMEQSFDDLACDITPSADIDLNESIYCGDNALSHDSSLAVDCVITTCDTSNYDLQVADQSHNTQDIDQPHIDAILRDLYPNEAIFSVNAPSNNESFDVYGSFPGDMVFDVRGYAPQDTDQSANSQNTDQSHKSEVSSTEHDTKLTQETWAESQSAAPDTLPDHGADHAVGVAENWSITPRAASFSEPCWEGRGRRGFHHHIPQ